MDRETVMSWLEGLAEPDWRECYSDSEVQETASQALDLIDELLKRQEPVEPKEIVNEHFPIGDYRRTMGWLCGKCGETLVGDGDYCSYCGRKVKWE